MSEKPGQFTTGLKFVNICERIAINTKTTIEQSSGTQNFVLAN